jgi:dTDP-4-dehydrorhamnose reductase
VTTLKILLFGRNGQLGWELQRTLAPLGRIIAIDQGDLDLSRQTDLEAFILHEKPNLIVNAAAYTNVDAAEDDRELAFAINQHAPGTMVRACEKLGAAIVHYSTDYVFNGEKKAPYTEADPVGPVNVYGQSKLAGESEVSTGGDAYLIFRTSWVYSFRRPSFPSKVIEWAQTKDTLRIVSDQIGSPTWARLLAECTALVLVKSRSDPRDWFKRFKGIYHLAGNGSCSRYELALQTLGIYTERTGSSLASITPARSDEFPSPAKRPKDSSLDCSKFESTFGLQIPSWQDSLRLAMDSFLAPQFA